MEKTLDINYINLFMGYLLVLIPVIIFYHYKTGLIKDSLIAVARMTVQLLVVGLYLEVLFEYNKTWINSLWWIIMVAIATFTIIRRAYLNRRYFFIPLAVSLLISLAIVDAYFLGIVIDLDYFFDARYFIPISGIILGNCLKTNILGLNTFYKAIRQEKVRYRYYLANGATQGEALAPFMREALKTAFNPLIATITVIGLISLPGLMTGQILGGSSPEVAIKYQIMLMISLFASTLISVVLTITIANRFVFDEYGNMKENVMKKNKNT
ncbi:MAG: ABC transporter permease [Bacteroidales bacterium]|nr:ABC transporter permease [Bacteroidales bacterium]